MPVRPTQTYDKYRIINPKGGANRYKPQQNDYANLINNLHDEVNRGISQASNLEHLRFNIQTDVAARMAAASNSYVALKEMEMKEGLSPMSITPLNTISLSSGALDVLKSDNQKALKAVSDIEYNLRVHFNKDHAESIYQNQMQWIQQNPNPSVDAIFLQHLQYAIEVCAEQQSNMLQQVNGIIALHNAKMEREKIEQDNKNNAAREAGNKATEAEAAKVRADESKTKAEAAMNLASNSKTTAIQKASEATENAAKTANAIATSSDAVAAKTRANARAQDAENAKTTAIAKESETATKVQEARSKNNAASTAAIDARNAANTASNATTSAAAVEANNTAKQKAIEAAKAAEETEAAALASELLANEVLNAQKIASEAASDVANALKEIEAFATSDAKNEAVAEAQAAEETFHKEASKIVLSSMIQEQLLIKTQLENYETLIMEQQTKQENLILPQQPRVPEQTIEVPISEGGQHTETAPTTYEEAQETAHTSYEEAQETAPTSYEEAQETESTAVEENSDVVTTTNISKRFTLQQKSNDKTGVVSDSGSVSTEENNEPAEEESAEDIKKREDKAKEEANLQKEVEAAKNAGENASEEPYTGISLLNPTRFFTSLNPTPVTFKSMIKFLIVLNYLTGVIIIAVGVMSSGVIVDYQMFFITFFFGSYGYLIANNHLKILLLIMSIMLFIFLFSYNDTSRTVARWLIIAAIIGFAYIFYFKE